MVASVAFTVTGKDPTNLGIPVTVPYSGLIFMPLGSPVADHIKGAFPPCELIPAMYELPTVPTGNSPTVIVSPVPMMIVKLAVAVCGGLDESVTVTITGNVPVDWGAPVN